MRQEQSMKAGHGLPSAEEYRRHAAWTREHAASSHLDAEQRRFLLKEAEIYEKQARLSGQQKTDDRA
jgi:hypothetical protein